VHSDKTDTINAKTKAFDFLPDQVADITGTAEHLRWIPLSALNEECMTLPIDKVAVKMLLDKHRF
jgi:hypothetical protein